MMQTFNMRNLLATASAWIGVCFTLGLAADAGAASLNVPVSRSQLITVSTEMSEVIVADPEIADVHAHGRTAISVIGKRPGHTTVRVMDKDSKTIASYDIVVGYDLPSIRKALKDFLPDETIGVEMVNANVALTGQVSSAMAADKAVRIVQQYVGAKGAGAAPATASGDQASASNDSGILNLLQITTGQQVMLRVRVGEIQRSALKTLGIDLEVVGNGLKGGVAFATGGGISALTAGSGIVPGQFNITGDNRGVLVGRYLNGDDAIAGLIKALERDGLFKLLAEPNLVAVSGEEAEFLAGGEIPVPVPQSGGGLTNTLTIEYKPFGVAVKFRPNVLSENRIRMEVQPEVSELDDSTSIVLQNFRVPGLTTRRARTTVELAPGESFMIAGLIKDQTRSNLDQLPGVKELPVLGALFRSTSFQRNETELVISVTPYLVDPMKSADVKLPTDGLIHASQMEMIFYGALSTLRGNAYRISQTPNLEGPIGFMVD